MTETAFAPLQMPTVSATDHVFQAIYDAVISLKLPPGTKVSENEIARQLGVSRQPVRDAFFRLSNLGFLLIRPQRATLVTPISEEAVLNAMFIRTAIEVECLRYAADHLDGDKLGRLRHHLEIQAETLSAEEPTRFHTVDDAFHALLCEVAGQAHAWGLIRDHKAHMDRIRVLTLSQQRQKEVVAEHTALIDSLEAGDLADAQDGMRAHLGRVRDVLAQIRSAHPAYFEPGTGARR